MPRRVRRNQNIKDEFKRMYAEGLRNEVILARLSDKYYLASDTIERIVWERGNYAKKGATA